MPRLEDVIQLKDDEEVRAITRRHGITIVPILALALVLIVVPFFFLFPLFSSGPAGIVVFLALVVTGIIIAARTFIIWDGDILVVTNIRIVDVDQQGVFARTVNEIAYESIQDFSWSKKTIIDQILNIGHFTARSASGSLNIEAKHVPRPQDLQNLVNDLRTEHLANLARASAPVVHPMPQRHIAVAEEDDQGVDEDEMIRERTEMMNELKKRMAHLSNAELDELMQKIKADDRDITIKRLFGEGAHMPKSLDEQEDATEESEEGTSDQEDDAT
jgi:hypothetical protein